MSCRGEKTSATVHYPNIMADQKKLSKYETLNGLYTLTWKKKKHKGFCNVKAISKDST